MAQANELLTKTIDNLLDRYFVMKKGHGDEVLEDEKKEKEEKSFSEGGEVNDAQNAKAAAPGSANIQGSQAKKGFSEGGDVNADSGQQAPAPAGDSKQSGASAVDTAAANGGGDKIGKANEEEEKPYQKSKEEEEAEKKEIAAKSKNPFKDKDEDGDKKEMKKSLAEVRQDFGSVVSVIKAVHEENKQLRKSLAEALEKIEKVAAQPAGIRKSMTGLIPVGKGSENVGGGGTGEALNKGSVLHALETLQKSDPTGKLVNWSDCITETEIHRGPISAERAPFNNGAAWKAVLEKIGTN